MEEKRKIKLQKEFDNQEQGIKWDVDFQLMVEQEKSKVAAPHSHSIPDMGTINIWVRKRPLFHKESLKGEIDWVSWTNPAILIHKWKLKVDGITKYVENLGFEFDNTFNEDESSDSLYYSSIQPQIDFLFDGGIVTWFAYGQTGSGKTFTMEGVQKLAVNDFFAGADIMREETGKLYTFTVSFYEIYNGKIYDLLDGHKMKRVQEDSKGSIQIPGLKEVQARSADEMTQLIEYGLSERKTKSTAWNDTSSRSHAIGTISIKQINKKNQIISECGKLLLVDLAGSEKAQDSQSNIRDRRVEGAEINTSLLALKEWIRAMDSGKKHVPFRQSKLTMVLRDSFIGGKKKNHVIMIACIAPDQSSSDHTLNTLRYAERLKYNSDDQTVEKYMNAKRVYRKSPETSFQKIVSDDNLDDDNEDDDVKYEDFIEKDSEININTFSKNNSHYQHVEHEDENYEIEEDNWYEDKYSNSHNKKLISFENNHPNFNENYKSTDRKTKDVKAYELRANKVSENKLNTNIEKAVNPETKSRYIYEGNRTHSYSQNYSCNTHLHMFRYNQDPKEQIITPEYDYEDQLMQVNADGADEHNSPQKYVSNNHRSELEPAKHSRVQHSHINPTIFHSNSNSKLHYNKVYPSTINYLVDKSSSSTTNFKAGTYDRANYTQKANLNFSAEKEILNKTSYDLTRRQKPISAITSYNPKPQVQKKYENYYRRDDNDDCFSYAKRYNNIISHSSYGKEMVASYNSYFRNHKQVVRPSAYP